MSVLNQSGSNHSAEAGDIGDRGGAAICQGHTTEQATAPPLLDTLSEVVFRTDAQGRWTYLNQAWTTLTGFEIEASLGTGFLEYVHPDEVEHTIALFMAVVEGGADHCHHETRYRTRDGSYRWVQIRASVQRGPDGEVIGNVGTIIDTTGARAGSVAIGEHNAMLELVSQNLRLDGVPVGVIIYDHTLRIARSSLVVNQLLGVPQDCGDPLQQLVDLLRPSDNKGQTLGGDWGMVAVALQTSMPQLGDFDLIHGAGTGRSLRLSVIPFSYQEKIALAVIFSDVSDLRRAERHQAGLALLGQHALSGLDLPALLVKAGELVTSTLDVTLCDLLETEEAADGEARMTARVSLGRPAGARSLGSLPAAPTSLLGQILSGDQPLLIDKSDPTTRVNSEDGQWPWMDGCRATVGARIGPVGRAFGVLAVHSSTPRRFMLDEVHFVQAAANMLALAVELSRAQNDRERLAVYEDRHRIARDLHDVVIQRLFATGLQLQAVGRAVAGEPGVRLSGAVEELDQTIDEIRRTIFALSPLSTHIGDLRAEVQRIVTQAEAYLGLTPIVRLEGPIDDGVPRPIHQHLLAALREALANIARHAQADHIAVRVSVSSDDVLVEVHDDGRGPGRAARTGGLANLCQRALGLGGRMEFGPGNNGTGSTLTWQVPLAWQASES